MDLEFTLEKIVEFIRRHTIELCRDGAVVGLSGGIDSCLVLKLCVQALGKDRVIAVILPERDSNHTNIRDAVEFAKELGVKYIYKRLTIILSLIGIYKLYPPTFLVKRSFIERFISKKRKEISDKVGKDIFIANLEGSSDKELCKGRAFYKVKHRLRSAILFYYSELNNYLLVGCSNKSEWLTGFFVKYGDSIADIMPIMSLYKTQVFRLAKFINMPDHILKKAPSPDLIPGIVDEEVLGLTYRKLDLILSCMEANDKIIKIYNFSEGDINRVREIVKKSEYLRKWPIELE
jgi:NAD+ synthase